MLEKRGCLARSLLAGIILLSRVPTGVAQPTNQASVEELRRARLPDVVLESVTLVVPEPGKSPHDPPHLRVEGVIGGHIRFELLLPEVWNGRFAMGGGGGFVGSIQNAARDSVRLGYATVGTDTGHQSPTVYLAGWAENNPEAQLNFAYLAVHRTAVTAKALLRAYYGADASSSYFVGCSRGGGQAMMEAQRYPEDFDGIVAGAPAFNWTGFAASMVSVAKALYPDPARLDHTALTKGALENLQKAIIEQGDAQDGLKDGIIANPPSVRFDLAKARGLTDEQRRAVQAIYDGARHGQELIYPGYTAGAECDPGQWTAWLVGPIPSMAAKDRVADLTFAFGTEIFKHFVFHDTNWNYATYDFSRFEEETRPAATLLNATSVDLDAFHARKGKLILWHGWADPALPALGTTDYYKKLLARDPKAADYCRLFMIPGCYHCGGGPGATEVDWLGVISDWVERGKAPDRLVASKSEGGKVSMTRPLYPYPQGTTYQGSGDPNRAESFAPCLDCGTARP